MTLRERYRLDPEFRARALARTKANHLANVNDPRYRELVRLRKLIWQRRESVDRLLKRASKLEKNLLVLLKKRDELAAARKGPRSKRDYAAD